VNTGSIGALTNTWHHLVYGWDSATNKLFIQLNGGARVLQTGTTTSIRNSTAAFSIGKWVANNTAWARCSMRNWGLWNGRVLSEAEAVTLYNAGVGLDYHDLGQYIVPITTRWDDVNIEEADWGHEKYAATIMVKTESPTSGGYVRQNLATGDDSSPVADLTARRVRNYYTIPPNNQWMYYRASCDARANYYAVREDGLRYYERLYKDAQSLEMQGPCLTKGSLIPTVYSHPEEPKTSEFVEFADPVHMNSFWTKLRWTPWHSCQNITSDMEIARFYIDGTNYIVLTQLGSDSFQREYNVSDIYNVHEPVFQLKKVRGGVTEETCTVVMYYGYTLTGTAQDWLLHDTIEFDIYHVAGAVMGMNVNRGGLDGVSTASDSGVTAFTGTTGTIKISGYGFHATPEVKMTVDSDAFRHSGPARSQLPTGRTDLMRRLQAPTQNPVFIGERDPSGGLIATTSSRPYVVDDFNRADDPNLGDDWYIIKQTGNGFNIISNKASCAQEGWERFGPIPKHADLITKADVAINNDNDLAGIGARLVRTTLSDVTCYGAELLQTGAAAATLRLVLWFEGTRTILATDALSAYTQGTEYLLRITTLGTTLTAEVLNLAGDTVLATAADTNAILTRAGRAAIYAETGGAGQFVTFDNFLITRNFTYGVS
jgi:hypothetical protein